MVVLHGDVDGVACLERDALGERVVAVGIDGIVEHSICAPASFFVHGTWGEVFYCFLYIFCMFFTAHQDTVRAGSLLLQILKQVDFVEPADARHNASKLGSALAERRFQDDGWWFQDDN